MKSPKYLYHGTPEKIKGKLITPRKAKDLAGRFENTQTAVYASQSKNIAISIGICKMASLSSHNMKIKSKGIIYYGWPRRKYIYLYTLPGRTFSYSAKQWVSFEPVKPIKMERLQVKKYLYLIRKATKKEKVIFLKKFGKKIPKTLNDKLIISGRK